MFSYVFVQFIRPGTNSWVPDLQVQVFSNEKQRQRDRGAACFRTDVFFSWPGKALLTGTHCGLKLPQ